QMPAGAFDDAGGDRPAGGQRGRVVQVGPLVGQVGDGPVNPNRCGASRISGVGGKLGDDLGRVSGQDLFDLVVDPGLGGRVGSGMQAPGRTPEIFEDMDEVDDDRHRYLPGGGFGADPLDLVGVAIEQADPGTAVVAVAAGCLVE